jgi:S-adenosylmethionine hydrolase
MSCITLLSDFGLQDASVASAKGILRQHTPQLPIIDITHLVEPYHLQQAAYLLAAAFNNFPAGTCHLVLFDVFSSKEPRLLLCQKQGSFLLAPDNGILSLAFNAEFDGIWNGFELVGNDGFKSWLHAAADIISRLQDTDPSALNLQPAQLQTAPVHWKPKIDGNVVECHVIHIDRYENVVINITRPEFEELGKGRNFRIRFMRDEELTELSTHYNNVREGEKLCRFNATGYLEIAINRGKAASLFGLRLHREQHVIYNTIKITFE